jgi:hypothetical protein
MGCVQAWSAHGDLWWKKFSILHWQARVGREICERKGRGNEKAAGGEAKRSSYDFSPLVVGGGTVSRLMPRGEHQLNILNLGR